MVRLKNPFEPLCEPSAAGSVFQFVVFQLCLHFGEVIGRDVEPRVLGNGQRGLQSGAALELALKNFVLFRLLQKRFQLLCWHGLLQTL